MQFNSIHTSVSIEFQWRLHQLKVKIVTLIEIDTSDEISISLITFLHS